MNRVVSVGTLAVCLLAGGVLIAAGAGTRSGDTSGSGTKGTTGTQVTAAASGAYTLLAWSELGMHCMDGKDYSVFAVLPPYNTIHAKLLRKGSDPAPITSGVTMTYEAMADASGSINTISSTKTNFWSYVRTLFLQSVPPDVGLKWNKVQSRTPQPLKYDPGLGLWVADGVPTSPVDDAGRKNPYPLVKLTARNSSGQVLAYATVVMAVSDEMSCNQCHASGKHPAAQPASGWENDPDPLKDVKWNILKLHDQRHNISGKLSELASKGYQYQSTLYTTAKSGTPVLCSACHLSNALNAVGMNTGVTGVPALTSSMHAKHGNVINLSTGTTLDKATSPAQSCYLCHPGLTTKCQRGAMHNTACYDCHGNLTQVGNPARAGWFDVPSCQMCHTKGQRYTTTFSSTGVFRSTTDTRFATNPNTPMTGKSMYRFSKGHGGVQCQGCHGAPHAEYPSLQANDNLYSQYLQGFAGKITECAVCHGTAPLTVSSGPHGMHTVGQSWVNAHPNYASSGRYTQCAACHGSNYRGTALSKTATARTFTYEGRTRSFAAGSVIGCYSCHNGPTGGD